jgi:hypothetical protein
MPLAPDAFGGLFILCRPWIVPHESLTSRADGLAMIVQAPEIIFWQLKHERDQLKDPIDDKFVGVFGKRSDLG